MSNTSGQSSRQVAAPAFEMETIKISEDGRCGAKFGNARCRYGQCCSQFGWCGGEHDKKSDWCSVDRSYHTGAFNGKYDGSW